MKIIAKIIDWESDTRGISKEGLSVPEDSVPVYKGVKDALKEEMKKQIGIASNFKKKEDGLYTELCFPNELSKELLDLCPVCSIRSSVESIKQGKAGDCTLNDVYLTSFILNGIKLKTLKEYREG